MSIKVLNEFLPPAETFNLGAIKVGTDFDIDEAGTLDLKTRQLLNGKITNCTIEIPQDVKLDITPTGIITLKAGSKVYIPNGFGVFDEITITSDMRFNESVNGSYIPVWSTDTNFLGAISLDNVIASTVAPENPTVNTLWYDTLHNVIQVYDAYTQTWNTKCILPVCIFTVNNGVTVIDQIFNGFGYVDRILFALPGVKGLTPNGRNEDGSLNNYMWTNSSVKTREFYYTYKDAALLFNGNTFECLPQTSYRYSEKENKNYDGVSITSCSLVGYIDETNGVVSNFRLKTAFHAADYNDVVLKSDLHIGETVVETYQNGTNWYRIWSSGWIEQGGYAARGTINLNKPFSNTDYTVMATSTDNTGAVGTDSDMGAIVKSKTTTSFNGNVGFQYGGNSYIAWYACGY